MLLVASILTFFDSVFCSLIYIYDFFIEVVKRFINMQQKHWYFMWFLKTWIFWLYVIGCQKTIKACNLSHGKSQGVHKAACFFQMKKPVSLVVNNCVVPLTCIFKIWRWCNVLIGKIFCCLWADWLILRKWILIKFLFVLLLGLF